MVPQLCFLAQTCPCADVVLQGAMRWMWNVHFCLWYWELLVLLIFACAFLTFFLFLTFWSLMYLYVLCFYRMCSTFNIMFSIKFYNIKHRAFCMCSTSIVFVKQWEAIIWLSCAGLCVFSWSRGTCKKIRRVLAQPKAHEAGCIDWILKLYCKHTKRNIKQVRNAQAKMSSTRSSKYQGQNGHLTFISWHFAAPHQHRDTFGPKTWVQGPYWPF